MSDTGPNQGTLKVFPDLLLGSAYILLRPFFRPLKCSEPNTPSLKFEDWAVNLDSPEFPGSVLGNTQELNERTHPHLDLAKTVVSVPRVDPGDQVFCTYHRASSSLAGGGSWTNRNRYVRRALRRHTCRRKSTPWNLRFFGDVYPSGTPYCRQVTCSYRMSRKKFANGSYINYSAHYLRLQRENFVAGLPPPYVHSLHEMMIFFNLIIVTFQVVKGNRDVSAEQR